MTTELTNIGQFLARFKRQPRRLTSPAASIGPVGSDKTVLLYTRSDVSIAVAAPADA